MTEYLGQTADGLPVYRAPWRVLPLEIAKGLGLCQMCKLRGRHRAKIPHSEIAGLRRAGDTGWKKVVLCPPCIAEARGTGYEVWEP